MDIVDVDMVDVDISQVSARCLPVVSYVSPRCLPGVSRVSPRCLLGVSGATALIYNKDSNECCSEAEVEEWLRRRRSGEEERVLFLDENVIRGWEASHLLVVCLYGAGWENLVMRAVGYCALVKIKMTVRGTMIRSEVCNSWCYVTARGHSISISINQHQSGSVSFSQH